MAGEEISTGRVLETTLHALRSRLRLHQEVCMKCRACDESCPIPGVPGLGEHTPTERIRVASRIARGERPGMDEVEKLYSCLLCGSCAASCPYGLELPLIICLARSVAAMKGASPPSLARMALAAARTGHSFGMSREEHRRWLKKHGWIPVDREGADVLYVPSPVETAFLKRHVLDTAVLLEKLGVDWTFSSNVLDTGGNIGVDCSRPDIGLAMLAKLIREAERLGVRRVAVGGCGSDYKWVPMAMSIYGELLPQADIVFTSIYRILAEKMGDKGLGEGQVLHDPCGMTRYVQASKGYDRLLSRAERPKRRGPYTLCCGGGGGMSLRRDETARRILENISAKRLDMLLARPGVGSLVTPCIKCYIVFKQAILKRGARTSVKGMASLLLDSLGGATRYER